MPIDPRQSPWYIAALRAARSDSAVIVVPSGRRSALVGFIVAGSPRGPLIGPRDAFLPTPPPELLPPDPDVCDALFAVAEREGAAIVGWQLPSLEEDLMRMLGPFARNRYRAAPHADIHEAAALLAASGDRLPKQLGIASLADAAGLDLPADPTDVDLLRATSAIWFRILLPRLRRRLAEDVSSEHRETVAPFEIPRGELRR